MNLMSREATAAYRLVHSFPLFDLADESGTISVCIIGSDPFCEEYLKAAVWSTQRDGFRIKLDLYTTAAECERLERCLPEIIHTAGLSDSREIFYEVRLRSEKPSGDYCIMLTSAPIAGRIPVNAAKMAVISDICGSPENGNSSGMDYFRKSGLEKQALSLARSFGNSAERFYNDGFCYRSSIAAALFWDIRRRQGESIEVCEKNMQLEHRRWNAFTRTEGYRFGTVRSDQAKTHPCLVAWDMLSSAYQQYDAAPIRNAGLYV